MAIASESSVTIIIRTWALMIIFCFAGCAAGSCLSYGHSCWGAHGKRSGGHNGYVLPLKGTNDVQQGLPSLTKEQLILSRLIGRPLVSNKYKGRWDRLFKVKSNSPLQLNDDDVNARVIFNEPIGDDNNNDDIDGDKRIRTNDAQYMMESINNSEKKEIPEVVLLLGNEEKEHGGRAQNLEFFKFLSDRNGNYE